MAELTFDSPGFSSVLLDTVGALIVVLDSQSRIVLFNRACEQLSGYTSAEVLGKDVEMFLTKDEAPLVHDVLVQLLDGDGPIQYNNYWVTRSGARRWIEWSNSAVKDGNGQPYLILATGIDVTERALKEKALRESEQRFSHLFRSSPAAISIHSNKDDSILDVNPIFEQWVGYSRDELIGKCLLDLGIINLNLSNVGPKDRTRIVGKPVHGEVTLHARDGRVIYSAVSMVRVFLAGNDCLILSLQDISERKVFEKQILEMNEKLERRVQERTTELEQQIELYRSLAESARDFIFVIDKNDTIQYVNEFGAQTFGLVAEEMIGKPREAFFPMDHSALQKSNLERIFAENQVDYYEEVVPFPKADLWLGTRLVPIHDQQGQVSAVLGVSRDVTDRKAAENELQQALQKEKELNELRANFVTMMSHQVGTPLSAILSSAEMLEHYGEHWPRSRQLKHLQRIIESTRQVDLMVRDILELGRVDASLMLGEETQADLVALCQDLIELFQMSDHNHHLICFSPPAYPVFCQIDEHLVQQALENLLSNALKYSPSDSQIGLKLSIVDQRLCIQIDDQGVGISEADLKRVGTPFYRGKNVSRIPGTGLGLTLVMRSIEALGGKMTINSRENSGTSVLLDLPFHPASLPTEPAGGPT